MFLPDREFWDIVACGCVWLLGVLVKCVPMYWELTHRNQDGLGW